MLIGSKIVGTRQDQVNEDFRLITYDAPFDTACVELRGTSIVRLITWHPRRTTPHSVSGKNISQKLTSNIWTVSADNLPPCAYMHRCFCDFSLVVSLDLSVLPRRVDTDVEGVVHAHAQLPHARRTLCLPSTDIYIYIYACIKCSFLIFPSLSFYFSLKARPGDSQ